MPTTCQIYNAHFDDSLPPSLGIALFHVLHFREGLSPYVPSNPVKRTALFVDAFKRRTRTSAQTRLHRGRCAILLNYLSEHANYLDVQLKVAEIGRRAGYASCFVNHPKSDRQGKTSRSWDISALPIPLERTKKLRILAKSLAETLCLDNPELGSKSDIADQLSRTAVGIEQWQTAYQVLLSSLRPRLVVLTNEKDPRDAGLCLAARQEKFPTLLIPHGFPQQSQRPIYSNHITQISTSHDNYYRKLKANGSTLHALGWLEPMLNNAQPFNREPMHEKNRRVLFLSQVSGWEIHRCSSLNDRAVELVDVLAACNSVESVRVRMHPREKRDPNFANMFYKTSSKNITVSENDNILDDLVETDLLVSFSSTGLLYGPYLGIQTMEVRDNQIDGVWKSEILPASCVFRSDDPFNPDSLSKMIARIPVLDGNAFFANYGREEEAISSLLKKILQ